jgi:cyclophilin family peptidyl-prolyl cis-trans isomerase
MFLGLALVVVAVLGVRYLYSKVSDDNASDATVDHTPQQAEEPARVTTTLAEPGSPVAPTCPAADGSSERTVQFTGPPPMCIDETRTYVAHVETTRGDFDITLDPADAPKNVNNFVFLARWHFYDGVGFHRVVPRYLVQAGDPIAPLTADGGPGYNVDDEFPTEQPYYPLWSVAIGNIPGEANSGNSEFFVVIGDEATRLPPAYSRIGQVSDGEDVVEAIGQTGAQDGSGDPLELTVIESITVTEG